MAADGPICNHPLSAIARPHGTIYLRRLHLAKAEWRRTGRPLREAGLLTDLDVSAFGAYCCAYAMHIEAEIKLQDEGMVIVNATGAQVSSPYVAINNQAVAQMRAFMGEFGLTPASRVRMPIGTVSRIPRRPRTTEQGDTPIDPRDTLRWEIQAGNN